MWKCEVSLDRYWVIEWVFYACDYSGVGYGDNRWKAHIMSFYFRVKQRQQNYYYILQLQYIV